jgi:maleate isomerase
LNIGRDFSGDVISMTEEVRKRRVGLLVPSSDTVMEVDLWRRLPIDITLHVARMYLESTTVAGEEKMLREELIPAAQRLTSVKPELIVFGCTSAAALHGLDGDAAIAQQVTEVAGCSTITVTQAVIDEIKGIQPQRIFLFTPYVPELTERLQGTFQEAGLPVEGTHGLGLDSDLEIAAVTPEKIREAVIESVRGLDEMADCVFISCTTFRAFEVADDIERELGVPVITSNKAAFQEIQRRVISRDDI